MCVSCVFGMMHLRFYIIYRFFFTFNHNAHASSAIFNNNALVEPRLCTGSVGIQVPDATKALPYPKTKVQ